MELLGVARVDLQKLGHPVAHLGADLYVAIIVNAVDPQDCCQFAVMTRIFRVTFDRKRTQGAGEGFQSFPYL